LLNNIHSTYAFIRSHPLGSRHKLRAINNWLAWQVRSRMLTGPHAIPFVGQTRLLVKRGMHGATGNIYCGLHEFADMAFVLHFLRPDDLFVDIGANIGSYSVIAAGVCGARTTAIEPVPATADALAANIALNDLGRLVTVQRCAVGESRGTVRLSTALDCMNHVLNIGEAEPAQEIPQITLDELLDGARPSLLKIDVEGYEYAVLRGARDTLGAPELQAVIVEANGSGKRYGHADEEVFGLLTAEGFSQYHYNAFTRTLSAADQGGRIEGNALFLRHPERVQQRVTAAQRVSVLGQSL